ncbi:Nif11-like leader peptide family natural product precursor [Mesorhizobium sp. M0152]|uniref:Nif11-like leader peptide family natural product precursor n=1 Tax=unclassified Mesorhizobium TaxID=325217 RepID=UPI003334B5AA
MSQAEVERFVDDLAKDGNLLEKVKPNATGLASIVAIAKSHGYNFTLDEAKSYIQSRSPRELTDKQLDAIFGGKHDPNVATSTKVAQTAVVVTTAVEAAEAATTVAEAAEAVVVVAAVLI